MIKPNVTVGSIKVTTEFLIAIRSKKFLSIWGQHLSNNIYYASTASLMITCSTNVNPKSRVELTVVITIYYINHTLKNKYPKKPAANEQENEGRNQNSVKHNHNFFWSKFTLLQIIPVILSHSIKNIKMFF